jgi:hypothetical protein
MIGTRDETMKETPAKLLLRKTEAATLLSISPRTLWGITVPRGPIPCVRIGNRSLYPYEALRRYVAENSGLPLVPAH